MPPSPSPAGAPPGPPEDWRRREVRLVWEACAPFWDADPPRPFPLAEERCPVCRTLAERVAGWDARAERDEARRRAAELRGEAPPPVTGPDLDEWMDTEDALGQHRRLHEALADGLPKDPGHRALFLEPRWDTSDGRPLLREPGPAAGVTARSKAFFLLHRHRFGRFILATMRSTSGAAGAGAPLRLFDDRGRGIELTGCPAGYGGEGPHGTLWVLRVARFSERFPAGPANSDLENLVYGHKAFQLRAPDG
jgi:hypothetical protein